MGSQRANQARLKSAVEFGRRDDRWLRVAQSVLRAVLYAIMELVKNVDGARCLPISRLTFPTTTDHDQREVSRELAGYLAKRLETLRPEEASAARVLCELVKNQRLG